MSNTEIVKVMPEHEQKLAELRNWMESQVKWKGRTDDNFISIFLRSRDFDVEDTKSILSTYFENKEKIPQWWTNWDLKDPVIVSIIHQKLITICIDKNPQLPSLVIVKLSRLGPNRHVYNTILKLAVIISNIVMRRPNCQLNGAICILDCSDHPWWPALHLFSLTIFKDFINSFYLGMPIKPKKVVAINCTGLAFMFINIIKPFLSQSFLDLVHHMGSDLSSLPDLVLAELLPNELGGKAGPMKEHEDACVNEIFAHTEYFADENGSN